MKLAHLESRPSALRCKMPRYCPTTNGRAGKLAGPGIASWWWKMVACMSNSNDRSTWTEDKGRSILVRMTGLKTAEIGRWLRKHRIALDMLISNRNPLFYHLHHLPDARYHSLPRTYLLSAKLLHVPLLRAYCCYSKVNRYKYRTAEQCPIHDSALRSCQN